LKSSLGNSLLLHVVLKRIKLGAVLGIKSNLLFIEKHSVNLNRATKASLVFQGPVNDGRLAYLAGLRIVEYLKVQFVDREWLEGGHLLDGFLRAVSDVRLVIPQSRLDQVVPCLVQKPVSTSRISGSRLTPLELFRVQDGV